MFSEPLTGCVVFGVGQIFPPRNKPNAPTQIFFTMNGKQIGLNILNLCLSKGMPDNAFPFYLLKISIFKGQSKLIAS